MSSVVTLEHLLPLLAAAMGLPAASPNQPHEAGLTARAAIDALAPRDARQAGAAAQVIALQTALLHACALLQQPGLAIDRAICLHRSVVALSKEVRTTSRALDPRQTRPAEICWQDPMSSEPARPEAAMSVALVAARSDPARQNPIRLNMDLAADTPPTLLPNPPAASVRHNPIRLNPTPEANAPPATLPDPPAAPERNNRICPNAGSAADTLPRPAPNPLPASMRRDPIHLNTGPAPDPLPTPSPNPAAAAVRRDPIRLNAAPHPLADPAGHRFSGDALARFAARRLAPGEDPFAVWEAAALAETQAETAPA